MKKSEFVLRAASASFGVAMTVWSLQGAAQLAKLTAKEFVELGRAFKGGAK